MPELFTYEDAIEEIKTLRKQIQQYRVARGNENILQGFDYPKSLKRLLNLKNRLSKLRKKK